MFNNTVLSDDSPDTQVVRFNQPVRESTVDFLYDTLVGQNISSIGDNLANTIVALWQQDLVTLTKDTTLAELVAAEATYTGYARVTLALWDGPFNATGGGKYMETGLLSIVADEADPFVDNVIGGYFILLPGTFLALAGTFDSPVPIAKTGDVVQFNVQLPYGVPIALVG